jgi:hypothetical protein
VAERALVSIRRRVAEENGAAYDAAWLRLKELVVGAGGHAWRFRSREDAAERIEFLEFAEGTDPREGEHGDRLLRSLDGFGVGRVEEWVGG